MDSYDIPEYGKCSAINADGSRKSVIDTAEPGISATDDGHVELDLSKVDSGFLDWLTKHLTTLADWARDQSEFNDNALIRLTATDGTDVDSVALSELREQDENKLVEIQAKVQDIYDQQVNYLRETWKCQNGHATKKWHHRWEDDLNNPMNCDSPDCNATPYRRLSEEANERLLDGASKDIVRVNTQQMVLGEQGKDDRESTSVVAEVDSHLTNEIERADDITVWALPKVTDQGSFYLHILGYRDDGDRGIEVTDELHEEVKERAEDAPGDIVEYIATSIAPHIVSRGGHTLARKSVALSIASAREDLRMRSRINVCLYGPPAVGKSDIAEHAIECSDIGTFVDGKNASATGLTVGLEDNSDLNGNETKFVAAGVLPQHDGGVVGLDEMDKMRTEDRQALLNPMESGSVTYEKVKNVELDANVSVIATANPQNGYFDLSEAPISQLGLGAPMQSRFDLIVTVNDTVARDMEDEREFVREMGRRKTGDKRSFEGTMDEQELREHFAVASTIDPEMTDAAQAKLDDTHARLRDAAANSEYDDARVTNRKYDSLIRLAYAHARLRLSDVVTIEDGKAACDMVLESWSRLVGTSLESGEEVAQLITSTGTRKKQKTMDRAMRAALALDNIGSGSIRISAVAKATDATEAQVEEALQTLEDQDMVSVSDETLTVSDDVSA